MSTVTKANPDPVVWVDNSGNDCYGNTPCTEKVKDAVPLVDSGGTIYVYEGNYDERVAIDKSVSLIGLNGSAVTKVGEMGGDVEPTIHIDENLWVNISGLLIRNSFIGGYKGIVSSANTFLTVKDCIFQNLITGIYITEGYLFAESNFFNVTDTKYAHQPNAIFVYGGSTSSIIVNNTFNYTMNGLAVRIHETAIQLIANNTFNQGSVGSEPEYGDRSGNIGLSNMGLTTGYTVVRNNTITNGYWGVMSEGTNATVENNTLTGCRICISANSYGKVPYPSNLTVANNSATFIGFGLQVANEWSYMNATNNTIMAQGKEAGIGVIVGAIGSSGRLDLGPNNTISNASLGVKTYYMTFTNATENTIFGTAEGFHSEGSDNINHNTIYSNEEGIRVQGNPQYGNRNISNNTITNSSVRAGIWIFSSSNNDLIQNNEITGGYRGIWITEGSSSKTIRWNNISNNVYGIQLEPVGSVSPGSIVVRRNNISMNEYGIHAFSSNGNILENNNISGNRNSGIYLDTVNSVTLRYSNITNNFMGIVLTEEQPPPFSSIVITRNSILGNTLWAVNSSMSDTLDVTENFFGAWSNDTIEEMLSGDLLYYPWLGYRESNVIIIEVPAVVYPGITYVIDKGIIVNSTSSLTFLSDVDVVFNNSLGQNFIQVNGQMTVGQDCTFSGNFGNFTVLYLNGSSGTISQSTFEGQLGLSIQSSGMAISDSSFLNGTNGVIINQGDNNSISGSKMSANRDNGTYLFSSSWNEYTNSEISLNGDFGVRVDMSDNNSIIGGDVETNGLACVSLWHSANNNVSLLNVTSCLNGIYSELSTSNSFTSNNISSNDYGIQLTSGSVNNTVWQSNISNNFVGIAVNSSHPNHINNNSILGNVYCAISAPSIWQDYLDAEGNYFGTNVSGQIEKLVTNNVDFTPWMDFRESNVDYISNSTQWTSNRTLQKGVIVNATGSLNITGTVGSPITITFNSTHKQNFIQVNNQSSVDDALLVTENGPFTFLYLNTTDGRILRSNLSNFMGIGIQSEEVRTAVSGISISDSDFHQGRYGIVLHGAANTLINGSDIMDNTHWGAFVHASDQIDVGTGNNISHSRHGFLVEESAQMNVTGNVFHNNTVSGMTFEGFWPSTILPWNRTYAEYNDVISNVFVDNTVGVTFGNYSRQNNATKNNLTANQDGVYITGSIFDGYHTVVSSEFSGNQRGVNIEKSIHNNVSENSFSDNEVGVYLQDVEPLPMPYPPITNTIQNNSIQNENSGDKGIHLVSSKRNLIYNNSVNSTFSGERGTDTWGMRLEGSSSNILSQNVIQINEYGIRLDDSPDNNLTFNNLTNNFYNFGVTGSEIGHFPQEINTSNLVNGTEIYYWVEVTGGEIPSSAGYVGLISCTNISVPNATIQNNYQGILLVNTMNSTIRNVTVSWTYHGAYLYLSVNNTIEGYGAYRSLFDNNTVGVRMHLTDQTEVTYTNFTNNTDAGIYITGTSSQYATWNNISRVYAGYTPWNGFGIRVEYVENMIISNSTIDHNGFGIYMYGGWPSVPDMAVTLIFNNISNNIVNGVRMVQAKDNLIVNNSFYQNALGMYVRYQSQLNEIYHNNFQGNTDNYSVDSRYENYWDNGYPLPDGGGNWWCGFPCDDTKSGENTGSGQPDDDPDGDGICDESHVIAYPDNIDKHPLRDPADVGPRQE